MVAVVAGLQTHYVNTDFDLSLRPRGAPGGSGTLLRQIEELSAQGLLGANEGDCALVHCAVPEDFQAHLASCGLALPRLLERSRIEPGAEFRPLGWSAEAIELNRRHLSPTRHPAPRVIRRVNARSFGVELERDLGPAVASGRVVMSANELASFLEGASARSTWVIKAEHGNAGLANRRLGGLRLTPGEQRFVTDCFTEDDRMIVERWLPRERDWCTVFDVPFRASSLRIHESICTDGGSLIGALFEPDGSGAARWADQLGEAAERIASTLEGEGYFGPVCLDSFTWRERGVERLRPLVDLNCRLSMSDRAHALWRRVAPERSLYYRFFGRRKLDLPNELTAVLAALGSRRYDPTERRGILIASPLWFGSGDRERSPGKLAVIFVADARQAVFELERWFRDAFER